MFTHFLTLDLDLPDAPFELQRLVLMELRRYGEPLRWAIVAVDGERGVVQIEAVVTTMTELLISPIAVTAV